MKNGRNLYPTSHGGRTDKHNMGNPKGGGMAEKVQKKEDYGMNKPSNGSFKDGFKNKNPYPFGC